MRHWYWKEGWSAEEIAERLGTTIEQVLRCPHQNGVAVRLGGTRHESNDAMCVLDELYADPDVRGALAHHGVPERRRRGSISERFPEPVALTEALIKSLYVDVGLSSDHMELLTGQPAGQVLDALHAAGIPVRPVGTFSPWRRRRLGSADHPQARAK